MAESEDCSHESWCVSRLHAFAARTDETADETQNYRHESWKTLYWKYPLASIGLTAMVCSSSVNFSISANTIDRLGTLRLIRWPSSSERELPHGQISVLRVPYGDAE